uniref:J domain-containing protein n=1 Tax=Meloidogyne enterolobii TaxID=390850 RepID=A0A6V7UI72_MELEN|nr:unnamed protein product [Meloidogyne enterolobii]
MTYFYDEQWVRPMGALGTAFSFTQLSYYSLITLCLYQFAMGKVEENRRKEVERLLEKGKVLLSKGNLQEALHHYHQAVELDPDDYQIYFRRATVHLASGRMNAALPDLDRVVELKPDFISGRLQRGNIYYKQGNLDRASDDYTFALRHDSENSEVRDKLKMIDQIREWVKSGNYYHENGDHDSAERVLSYALEHCNWDADLHRKRGKIRLARGDTQNAISDIRAVAKLVPDSTEVYLEISRIYYETGDAENAMTQIRECLHLNPEHPLCFPFYKKIKKLLKLRKDLDNSIQKERWTECLDKSTSILKFEQDVDRIQLDTYKQRCKCNVKLGHVAEAIQECTEVLKYVDENDLEVLLNRGEAYLLNEDYDSAVEDFQKAVKANEDSRQAKEALNRALKLQKQAKKRDYYKILGVRRNADKRTIMKAYRKLAQQWHPDNFQDDAEKKRAQEKFILIAAAKDVLTDPEKRRIFDSGEDPMDPQGGGGGHHGFQQWQWSGGQGGFPFGEGFNPFGDDGGQYSFKFNFG